MPTERNPVSEHLLRELTPQVLGSLMHRFHDFAACEDAVQEALIAAALQWPADGMPDSPKGWLIQVAARRMTDSIRSEGARRRRENELGQQTAFEVSAAELAAQEDDTLALLFMCSHPSLTMSSAIALTLRAVGGLTTAEIANAFMVPEATMAQRISRAKATIKAAGARFDVPTAQDRNARLTAVLHVVYLIFNEGYTSSEGDRLQRIELSAEAIRIGRLVHQLAPDNSEATGLLALMLLTDARRHARSTPGGDLIPLPQQDRSLWDADEIAEGIGLLTSALTKGAIGSYQLQAAIAAVHDEARRAEDTDWPQILALYDLLQHTSDNPMIRLNRSVAVAMVHGPERGLALLADLDRDQRVGEHHRLEAVRAHLFEMANDHQTAVKHYRLAASRATNIPERNYLLAQAARLTESITPDES